MLLPEYKFPDMQIFCLLSSPNPVLVTKGSLCASSYTMKALVLSLSFGQWFDWQRSVWSEWPDTAECALKRSPSQDWWITEIILKYGLHENYLPCKPFIVHSCKVKIILSKIWLEITIIKTIIKSHYREQNKGLLPLAFDSDFLAIL